MIPVHTTTITVLADGADPYAEPYGEPVADTVIASGVRAVIDVPLGRMAGQEQRAGGEQTTTQVRLACDVVPLTRLHRVRDERTLVEYRVVWVTAYLTGTPEEHLAAALEIVEGVV